MIVNKKKLKKRKLKKGLKKKEKIVFIKSVSNGNIPPFMPLGSDLISTSGTQRLSKVARQLNMRISEIADFLKDNGFEIEYKPNSKLTTEQIEFLNDSRKEKLVDDFQVIDYTWKLLEDLKLDYSLIFSISPEQFENLVAEFLTKNNFSVRLNGETNRKDGGIDLIAWKKEIVTIIIAIQVKFKSKISKKVTASEIRDFKGSLSINNYFTAGMVVTNTDFTADARWIEEQLNSSLELKNSNDLKSWLNSNFSSKKKISLDLNLGKDIYFNEEI